MKKSLVVVAGLFYLLLLTGAANAELITIGTASYDSDESGSIDNDEYYNLIYHADGPFGPIVWLDYTHPHDTWQTQIDWLARLDSELSINLDLGYSVKWYDSWRMPHTVDAPYAEATYDGMSSYGFNNTTSEMGHLYYTELNNKGEFAPDSDGTSKQPGWGLANTGYFESLEAEFYRSGTDYTEIPNHTWAFLMKSGGQTNQAKYSPVRVIAVRNVEVSVVPEPATLLLLGFGLLGFTGISRKKTNGYYFT